MSSYIINFTNTSSETGSVIADAGFNYTDRLNSINEANIKITGSSPIKRSLIEIGSQVKIYRNGTLEFHGLLNSVDYLEGGGMSVNAQGYEIWMAKENGDYASSPWSATASATIFSAIIAESNYFSGGTVETGTSIDFKSEVTESLWNAMKNLSTKTSQDIGIDYSNSEIDILDHKGSSTSVMTLNSGIQMKDIRVSQSYPLGNDVRVYGRSEGETRIKSDNASYGQDATSKSSYGTIRKIVRDPSITTAGEANILADALVAVYKDPVKVYDFDVINPNQSLVAGDVVTLNSQTQGLTNEEVRIVGIEKGVRGGNEYLTLEVTNKAYSNSVKSKNEVIAEIEKNARDNQTYDQYPGEYSNQNCATLVGGCSCFDGATTCLSGMGVLGNGACGCSGDWFYLDANVSLPSHTLQAGTLNINASSANNCISGCLDVSSVVFATCFCGAVSSASTFWVDGTNPYIVPCSSCGICMTGDIVSANSTNTVGCAGSPGAFAEFHGACGSFTTCTITPNVVASGDLDLYRGTSTKVASFGASQALFGTIRTKDIHALSDGSCCVGISACRFLGGYLNNVYACRKLVLPVGTNCY